MSSLTPRTIRTPAMITAVHISLRDDVYRLLKTLRSAKSQYRASRAGKMADPAQATQAVEQMQFCSRAVQVFAHMAIEAALNAYGLLRFGAQPFESVAARAGPARKAKILLEAALRTRLADTDEIIQVVQRSARRRNALVHERAELHLTDETGTFHTVSGGPVAPVDLEAARLAIADMERFFDLLPAYDSEAVILCQPRRATPPRRRKRQAQSPTSTVRRGRRIVTRRRANEVAARRIR